MDVNGSTGTPQPVPQALYVNNSALPNLNLQSSFIPTSLGQNAPSSASLNTDHGVSNLPPGLRSNSVQPGPPPALVPVSASMPGRTTHGSYPPTYTEAVNTTMTRRPLPVQSQQPQQRAPAASQQPSSVTNGQDGMRVLLEAHQIRVGTRKFMPASNVVFKDDGVLFTLREYTHAPLLLNARAIIKCKANLNDVHPVLFFALEASCVKQIRSIFHMTEDEFNEKDPMEKKRCITVFPKSLSSSEAAAIHHSFNSMKAKFGRVENIVFPIDMDTAIDIIYGTSDRSPAQSSTSVRQPVTNGVSSNNRSHPYQRSIQQQQIQHPAMARPQQMQQQRMAQQNNLLTASLNQNNMMIQSMQRPQMAAGGMRMAMPGLPGQPQRLATQQPITIPQDGASFAALQKSLQPNMIYPVIQPNDNRRITHCLWTGTSFQPLNNTENGPTTRARARAKSRDDEISQTRRTMDSTSNDDSTPEVPTDEVRLHCHNARVGSLRCQSGEPVIIKNQNSRLSIHFKVKVGQEPAASFHISEDELSHCFICFQRVTAMFLFPNSAICQRLRYSLKMKEPSKDPSYDINSNEERQRHLILFLRDISQQTKDELLKMKRLMGQSNKPFISELDAQGALKILSGIKSNTPGLTGGKQPTLNELSSLAQEIANTEPIQARVVDDDDDDVIIASEELTIKCPYTQQVMVEPVRNKNCNHSYEKKAIIEFITRRRAKGTDKSAKCPYAGCGNLVPLTMEDLEDNLELKAYIKQKTAAGNSTNAPPATSIGS